MAQPARPLRADAARNRARVLEVAYETFAAEGLGVPIDEIARRAGVGAGTVYRHFPTKEDLFRAVIEDRIQPHRRRRPRRCWPPAIRGRRCSPSCGRWCCSGARPTAVWPTRSPGSGSTSRTRCPRPRRRFLALLGELLRAAQDAGTVRRDVDVPDVKAIVVGCQAMQAYRARRGRAAHRGRPGRVARRLSDLALALVEC